jgi:two-component system, cell cycle sensor histidine kinase and response regulator CckA
MNNEKKPDMTVLLVEDDQLLNKTIQKLLQREGFTTEGFLSGKNVLDRLSASSSDVLLLLDYTLPDMTGKEIIAAMRARGLDIPFVIITGHGDEQLAVEMMKLGAMDYIVKSLQFHEVVPSKVRRACEEIAGQHNLAQAEEKNRKLEDQLRQSQKLEAIGQLAGGVAHDFNNLLGGIMGNAELIKIHSGKDPTIDRYSDVIISSSAKAADLTRQLLTFARKVRVNFTKVNIHAGMENVIELLEHTIDRRIEIAKKFEAESFLVQGDSNMIENALLNIAINARDAMPAGGTLSFATDNVMLNEANKPRTVPELDIGAYVRVTIRDTGSGMDEKTMLRIFEPFFTTKEVGKGTGLGLAAVYGCVRQHNGHVIVESELGKGSAFIMYLPVSHVNEQQSGPSAQECVNGKGNILIVDDEQAIGEIAVELLSGIGYTPTYMNSAAEAIEYFKKNHSSVDAVILDIIMPKMNGLDVFRELKRLNPRVKVIIASGYSDEKQDAVLKEEGATVFVNKPYSLSELSKALAGVLGGEK